MFPWVVASWWYDWNLHLSWYLKDSKRVIRWRDRPSSWYGSTWIVWSVPYRGGILKSSFYQFAPNLEFKGSMMNGKTSPPILMPLDVRPRAMPRCFEKYWGTILSAIYVKRGIVSRRHDHGLVLLLLFAYIKHDGHTRSINNTMCQVKMPNL